MIEVIMRAGFWANIQILCFLGTAVLLWRVHVMRRSVLAEIKAVKADGFLLVPRNPTRAMLTAGGQYGSSDAVIVWDRMIVAWEKEREAAK